MLVVRWPVGGIRSYLRYTYGLFEPGEFDLSIVGPDTEEFRSCADVLKRHEPELLLAKSSSPVDLGKAILSACRRIGPHAVHSQGYSSGLLAAGPAWLSGAGHVVSVHDMFTPEMSRKPSVRIGRVALGLALGITDVVQPTGPAVEENYRQNMNFWPATRAEVRTIRNGIDIARFAGDAVRDLRSELGLGPADLVVGFVGRFMAIKGFAILLSAIDKLERSGALTGRKVVVVAVGSGGFIREEKAQIQARGLDGNIHFLPHTDRVAETLRGMDVLVIPSISEASPILPMEALVSGVPVIASDCPGLRSALANTPATLFSNRDSQALADRLAAFSPDSQRKKFAEFRETASRRFDSRESAADLLDLLRRLSASSHRS